MSDVHSWSTTAASNNSAAPDGAPEGMAPSGVNDTIRENMAAITSWYKDQQGTLVTGGTTTDYTLTTNTVYTNLNQLPLLVMEFNAANAVDATLNVDGLGAKTLKKRNNANLAAGDILINQRVAVIYNADNDTFEVLSSVVAPITTSGRLRQITTFTASGTYTEPSWLNFAIVEVVGGGGGGGGTAATGAGQIAVGAGGGGGGYAREKLAASAIGATETVTIGAGGAGGVGGVIGTAGGTSSFGSLLSATGGGGGNGSVASGAANAGFSNAGSGGAGSGGDINLGAGSGGPGIGYDAPSVQSGFGGHSLYGQGGQGKVTGVGVVAGVAANGYGGGGGGAGAGVSQSAQNGGAGTDGIILVWEYE